MPKSSLDHGEVQRLTLIVIQVDNFEDWISKMYIRYFTHQGSHRWGNMRINTLCIPYMLVLKYGSNKGTCISISVKANAFYIYSCCCPAIFDVYARVCEVCIWYTHVIIYQRRLIYRPSWEWGKGTHKTLLSTYFIAHIHKMLTQVHHKLWR